MYHRLHHGQARAGSAWSMRCRRCGRSCSHPGEKPPQIPADLNDSIATLRRNVAQSLLRGQGLWLYDFGPHGKGGAGWWRHPELLEEIGRLKRLAEGLIERPHRSSADVLLVYDMKGAYYSAVRSEKDAYGRGWSWFGMRNRTIAMAHHSGAMVDSVFLPDLPKVDWKRYRLVIFVETPLMSDEQARFIRQTVMRDDRHLIFTYAAGYTDGRTVSLQRMNELIGIRLKEVNIPSPARITTGGELPRLEYPVLMGYARLGQHLDYRPHENLASAGRSGGSAR